jgi:hypothetical protein
MAVIRPDWVNTGPEIYAPPEYRTTEPSNIDRVAYLRPQTSDAGQSNQRPTENLERLIRRIADASIDEIDSVIRELQIVRDKLRNEGERVSHELANYAALNHASTTAIRTIVDSLNKWKNEDKLR